MPGFIDNVSVRLTPVAGFMERFKGVFCALLLLLVSLVALGHAMTRSLFYDEIITINVAALPTWGDVWGFYAKGLDTPSPLSSLVVRPMLHLHASPEIAARLPFLFAFLVFLYCMYRMLLRYYPAGYALAALLVPVHFDELFFYSYEARVYAFMLAAVAVALLCWQSAADRPSRWTALGVWAGLALAMFCHAFAILLFIPFAAGEWLRCRERKFVDWGMWLALLLFPVGFLPVLSAERNASAFYRAQFFAQPGLRLIPGLFSKYLGSGWVVLTIVFCTGLALPAYRCWSAAGSTSTASGRARIKASEALLLVVLAALPIYGMCAGLLLHAFREPYILSFYLGFVLLAIALVAEAACRNAGVGLGLLCLLLLGLANNKHFLQIDLHHWLHHEDTHAAFADASQHDPYIEIARSTQLPIAFGDHVLYSSHFEYDDAGLRARMVYPIDIADSAPYPKSITSEINFKLFGSLFGWQYPEWQAFSQQHPHFVLLRSGDPNVWLFPYLCERMKTRGDVTMRLLASSTSGDLQLYDVQVAR